MEKKAIMYYCYSCNQNQWAIGSTVNCCKEPKLEAVGISEPLGYKAKG